jgi:hypothetical protein
VTGSSDTISRTECPALWSAFAGWFIANFLEVASIVVSKYGKSETGVAGT